MAYDIESNALVLLPRQEGLFGDRVKLIAKRAWMLDLGAREWQLRSGVSYGLGPMAYDAQSDRTVLFLGARPSTAMDLTAMAETWAYDANSDTWTDMDPDTSPRGLLGTQMVYDAQSDRTILYSGWNVRGGTWENDPATWAYDYDTNTWEELAPTGEPPIGWNYYALSYDAGADRVIAYRCGHGSSDDASCRIGVYDYESNTWERRETATHPVAYDYNVMVYDPGTRLSILFGGLDQDENPLNETWGYDYVTNTWTELETTNPPSPRAWHAMAYHESEGVVVVFGGGPARDAFTDELWVLDTTTMAWEQIKAVP